MTAGATSLSSLALPVVSRRWRKGFLRAPAAAVPGSAPVPAGTAQSPHGATGRVAPLFNLCAATRCRVPRHAHEAKRFGLAVPKMHKAKLDGSTWLRVASGAIQGSPWRSAHRVITPWVPVLELAACKTLATPSPGSTRSHLSGNYALLGPQPRETALIEASQAIASPVLQPALLQPQS